MISVFHRAFKRGYVAGRKDERDALREAVEKGAPYDAASAELDIWFWKLAQSWRADGYAAGVADARAAIKSEYLTENTGSIDDVAYDRALDDALEALDKLVLQPKDDAS